MLSNFFRMICAVSCFTKSLVLFLEKYAGDIASPCPTDLERERDREIRAPFDVRGSTV